MGCCNPYALGNIALSGDGIYQIESHGCPSATYQSLVNADIPSYAHGFYSPTEHEALSEVRYSRTEIGYDKGLRDIKRALEGAPMEAYVPSGHFGGDDSGSAVPKTGTIEPEIVEPIIIKQPSKNVVDEILKAQKQVTGREITLSEFEVEEIIIKRRIKKREIRIKSS